MSTSAGVAVAAALVGLVALLALFVAVERAHRERRTSRREADAERLRPVVLGALGTRGPAVAPADRRGPTARVLEELAVGVLERTRGADREGVVAVLGSTGALGRARDGLDSARAARRRHSVELLGVAGDRSARRLVVARLADRDADVRAAAARALGRIGGPGAVAPVMEALGDRRVSATTVSMALLRLGPAAAPEVRSHLLDGHDPAVRVVAADVLGVLGDRPSRPALEEAVGDTAVRVSAVRALGRLGDPRSVPVLLDRLEDQLEAPLVLFDRQLTLALVEALGLVGDRRAVGTLSRCFGRTQRLSQAASAALAPMGPRRSLRSMREREEQERRSRGVPVASLAGVVRPATLPSPRSSRG